MKKSKVRSIASRLALCTVSMSMLLSAGCGKPKMNEGGKVAVIAKNNTISFWEEVRKGAEDAGEELGYDIIYNAATADKDYSSQIEFINDAISQKVDAIVIAPNSPTELNEALEKADKAGIKIITINSNVEYEGVLSCVSSSDADGGAICARHAAETILANDNIRKAVTAPDADVNTVLTLGKGAIGVVGHDAATAEARIKGFEEECAVQMITQMYRDDVDFDMGGADMTDEEVAQMFVSAGFYKETERVSKIEDAYEETKKLIKQNPNLLIIFATNTNTTLGAAQAVEELGMEDQIYLAGFNSDQQELDYLKKHIIDGLVIQNPYNMGYVGVRFAKKAMDDQALAKSLDTGVTWVTPSNLDQEYIQLLLNPDKF